MVRAHNIHVVVNRLHIFLRVALNVKCRLKHKAHPIEWVDRACMQNRFDAQGSHVEEAFLADELVVELKYDIGFTIVFVVISKVTINRSVYIIPVQRSLLLLNLFRHLLNLLLFLDNRYRDKFGLELPMLFHWFLLLRLHFLA